MKKILVRRTSILLAVLCLATALCSCGKTQAEPSVSGVSLIHEPEFGGVYITKTIDEFNALGFAYGDSVNVRFSNGYELEDLPYYNGYYVKNGSPLLIAYPGYDYIKAAINNGDDLWDVAGIEEDTTAEITLNAHGKYLTVQEARDLHYQDERDAFASDAVFANFRSVTAGRIAEGLLYRSASPCDNQHNRAPYVDRLIREAGVGFILNLADTDEKLQGYIASEGFDSPYFLERYGAGQVLPLAMNMNFGSDVFREKIATGFRAMAASSGPYLVHCTEGKDRTGFVCMLLEALCGASYQEIVDDYMITYDNYYQITKENDPSKYTVIVEELLEPMIRTLGVEAEDLSEAELEPAARTFLRNAGMSEAEIGELVSHLTGEP